MSHLTANPFAKHFEFPRPGPLLTPPDTESEYANHALQPAPAPTPAPLALGIDLGDPLPVLSSHRSVPSAATETPPLRKGPSLQYIHSGPREARERVVQRGVRWLVVVVPPASVVTDRAHFGHTLSVGTPDKLPEGLLMPLFPTMSGQIGAIAREFSFPSTSGLCLYLHTNVEGMATMPRISDEAWQMLWAAYFEPRSPTTGGSPGQLPISGRIEFDIDLRKARWYDTWLGSGRRDLVDVPVSVTPSRPQSVSHWRGDSRTTFLDDQQDDQNDSTSMLTIARGPGRTQGGSRHIPRKLSLLDRVEAFSLRSGSKLNPRNLSPPSPGPLSRDAVAAAAIAVGSVLALSPVAQEDEPKSARKDINMLVNSWRESASLAASPMAATGQTSLDPANMPNDLPLVEDELAVTEELNLDDFAWSVSSLGPPDDEYDDADERASLESWRLPSVHMDRRMAASVCLTPTTATSWGPIWDSDYEYDDAAADEEMYWTSHSPDLGERMIEDCPPTPTTATSWGPASYDAASPLSQASFVLSIDLGARMMEDCPPTPTTATSWGPASYDAGSPLSDASFALSIDLAHRGAGSVPLTPATATSWGPPLEWPASPAEPHYVRTPDVGQRTFDVDAPRAVPWHHVWPYQGSDIGEEDNEQLPEFVHPYHDASALLQAEEQESGPWRQVWPYRAPSPATVEREGAAPYPFVYPYYDASLPSQAPESGPWKQVWPYRAPSPSAVESEGAGPYPFVYPYYNAASTSTLEPPHQVGPSRGAEEVSINVSPRNQTQPALTMVFPWKGADSDKLAAEPYRRAETKSSFVGASAQNYPYLTIYPAVYPHHDFYPAPAAAEVDAVSTKERPVRLEVAYPTVRPYHPGYPHIELYPPVSLSSSPRFAVAVAVEKALEPVSLKVAVGYPVFNIYPSVYPHNLSEIYGPATTNTTLPAGLPVARAVVEPYRHVYPYNLKRLYPAVELIRAKEQHVSVEVFEVMNTEREPITLKLPAHYPNISLYEPGYPWNLERIYPSVRSADSDDNECEDPTAYPHNLRYIYSLNLTKEVEVIKKAGVVQLAAGYPAMEIYSPVYPWNLEHIYPSVSVGSDDDECVDPTAYPHSLRYIYNLNLSKAARVSKKVPVSKDITVTKKSEVVKLASGYPALEIYSPVYPWNLERIYPSVRSTESKDCVCEDPTAYPYSLQYIYTPSPKKEAVVVKLVAEYPATEIYSPVYPWNLEHIYPSVKAVETAAVRGATGIVIALHANYPHIELYAPVYPYNLQSIYPSITALTTASARRASKHNTPAMRTSRPHLRDHSHHAKRSSSARLPPPPVPPLPQNVEILRPIHPTSRRPLSGERVAMSLPVRLPAFYPRICLYPPAYPHFDLYPQRAAAPAIKYMSVSPIMLQSAYPMLNIYPAVYPFLEIYPQAAAAKIVSLKAVDSVVKVAPIAANGFLPRKQPKRTHDELHRMVFGDGPAEETKSSQEEVVLVSREVPDQQKDVVPALPATASIPEESTPPKTSRRLPPVPPPQMPLPPVPPPQMPLPPVPPPQIPLPSIPTQTAVPVPQSPALTNAAITPSPAPSPSSSPRSRGRSGTVSARPPLPSPPATALSIAPALVSVSAPSPVTTSPTIRRLPALPEDASANPSPTTPSRRPMSVRVGLPSSPAATRRMSIVQPPTRRATSFAPLASVPEPSVPAPTIPAASPVSPFRPLPPQPQTQTPERSPPMPADLQRSHSASLRPSALAPVSEGSDLARRKSLPPRPLPRTRRDSVAAAPSGTVAGLARAYNTSTLSTVDEQVGPASPPRAPLPPVPNNRPPVSKLDRSKYPFA